MCLPSKIEHTLLGHELDQELVRAHVAEAIKFGVFGVCLPMAFVPLAKKLLSSSLRKQKVITVIDFPLGQALVSEKIFEAKAAQALGADELDLVMDYSALKRRQYDRAYQGIKQVVEQVTPLPVKIIVETSALDRWELAIACALVALSGASFIKTSTGFHKAGAKLQDIILMRSLLPRHVLIKASGGIKDRETAVSMIKAGASRIGASKTKNILYN